MSDRRVWLAVAVLCAVGCSSGGSSNGAAADAGTDATSHPGDSGADARGDALPTDGAGGGGDGATDAGLPGPCTPNATLACSCAGADAGAVGIQQCLPDGRAWRACACQSYAAQIAVDPVKGSDTNAGTLAAPFKTLGRAQTAVRALGDAGLPAGGVVVWLRGGTYTMEATFPLTTADSGTSASTVTWSGYPGEVADLVGGQALAPSSFTAVTSSSPVWARLDPSAQGQVVVASLPALGITDYGTLQERGFCHGGNQAALELSFDGTALPLARWPDADANVAPPGDGGPSPTNHGFAPVTKALSGTQFGFDSTRPARWSQATDVWVHGMFEYEWADCHEAVTKVDAAGQTITLAATPGYGITTAGVWYAENLLEEITEPGEWYLDRSSGNLYLWPPSSLTGATIVASTLNAPLVSVTGASYVTLRDITFESGRAQLVSVSNGANVQLLGVTLRNAGTAGATLDGHAVGASYALVYGTGALGISLSGGDRSSLAPGNDYVDDSNIHDFGRWEWMYQPGISINDDGNRASNNAIHDAPHAAILYGGNDHTIALNDIHDACRYTADAGAIYAGRDWGARGNVIKNNYLHAITSFLSADVNAIYLDDCLSGITVQGNIVDGVGSYGVLHGGGRDDLMTDNVLARCGGAGLSADARCLTWLPQGTPNDTPGDSWDLLGKLEAENYQKDPWASAFPACAAIPDDWSTIIAPDAGWLLPQGTTFSRNIGYANGTWIRQQDAHALPAYAAVADDVGDAGNPFVDEDAGDMQLTDAAIASVPGLQTVPFSSIGIQR